MALILLPALIILVILVILILTLLLKIETEGWPGIIIAIIMAIMAGFVFFFGVYPFLKGS